MRKDSHKRYGGYRTVEWIKFFIPVLTASIALFFSLLILADCKASVQVGEKNDKPSLQWFGLFSHAMQSDNYNYIKNNTDRMNITAITLPQQPVISSFCVAYSSDNGSVLFDNGPKVSDFQLLTTARVSSLVVVFAGSILWIVLVFSPFSRTLNGVWSKIVGIGTALVIGNLQLLSVAKFVRFILDVYPKERVYYRYKGMVISSVFFWLLTALAIALCGVKPARQQGPRKVNCKRSVGSNAADRQRSFENRNDEKNKASSSIDQRKRGEGEAEYKTPSAKDQELEQVIVDGGSILQFFVVQSISEDTKETKDTLKDLEEGDFGGNLGKSTSTDTPETNDMLEDIEIVLSESAEGTEASS